MYFSPVLLTIGMDSLLRIFQHINRTTATMRTFLFISLLFVQIPSWYGYQFNQFCTTLNNNTWSGFVQAIEDSSAYGLAVLCPFAINGDGCPKNLPDGYRVNMGSVLFVSCDPFLYGYNINSECIIDCPGRHFTISEFSSLTIERMVLAGATDSSIKVEAEGTLNIINSIVKDNVANAGNGNGGAITSQREADIRIEYSQFLRNQGLYGGAIFGDKQSTVLVVESVFESNVAIIAGGAFANEVNSNIRFENSIFQYNTASSGGAIYNAGSSDAKIFGNKFDENQAVNGGALYNEGFSDVFESIFNENFAEDSGGALYIDAGASTVLKRNDYVNNNAGKFGPAVSNRFNTIIERENNIACGNRLISQNSQCDGVFVLVTRRRVRCEPFANECISPTIGPTETSSSVAPSSYPSLSPSRSPSLIQTSKPSTMPSQMGSGQPSMTPTLMISTKPSKEVLFEPSSAPSQVLSNQPSLMKSSVPTNVTEQPSSQISSTPTKGPSNAPSRALSFQPSLRGSSGSTPSQVVSEQPSRWVSSVPSDQPSDSPTFISSQQPSFVLSSRPTNGPSSSPSNVSSEKPSLMNSSAPSQLPSSSPSTMHSSEPSFDPTVNPSSYPTRNVNTLKPSPSPSIPIPIPISWSTNFPLGICEGDCDSDTDCESGLICFQRDRRGAVPGCSGGEDNTSKTDYCIRDNRPPSRTSLPTLVSTPLPTPQHSEYPSKFPSIEPSYQNSESPTKASSFEPTKVGSLSPTSTPSTSPFLASNAPSVMPSTLKPLEPSISPTFLHPSAKPSVEEIPRISWSTDFPLKRCEGDCDSDADCESGLLCFQRGKREEVPGCSGGRENTSQTDYCIKTNHAR